MEQQKARQIQQSQFSDGSRWEIVRTKAYDHCVAHGKKSTSCSPAAHGGVTEIFRDPDGKKAVINVNGSNIEGRLS